MHHLAIKLYTFSQIIKFNKIFSTLKFISEILKAHIFSYVTSLMYTEVKNNWRNLRGYKYYYDP